VLIPCAPDYTCATPKSKRCKAVAHVAQKRGPCKLFFAFRDLERGRASRSPAAVSMGEAGEHVLVVKIVAANDFPGTFYFL